LATNDLIIMHASWNFVSKMINSLC
jgi:hypothetical protein